MNNRVVCCFNPNQPAHGSKDLASASCFIFTFHQQLLRVHYYALLKVSSGLLSCTGTFAYTCQVLHIYEVNPTAVVKVKVRHVGYDIRIRIDCT